MKIEDIEHFIMIIASDEEINDRGKEVNKLYSWSYGAKWMRNEIIKALKKEIPKHTSAGRCPCCNCPDCSGTSVIG